MRRPVPPSPLWRCIGNTIRMRRERVGVTQADLAVAIGVTRVSVTNTEAGRQEMPLRHLVGIGRVLDVDYRTLLPDPEVLAWLGGGEK